ncbi:hypothetical protein J113_26530 [Mycobacterium tuberculosis CAS/NITR204]|uniref:Uncharacterized protein n=1 Tax=Mycobacterium tuberculosis CAS/NITR204 TaxID=1310114 RepID=R4MP79_MYCTX|nr:hypothetical protein J113_26530 [Mycobacterium tuberculosis CAS/NITR204]
MIVEQFQRGRPGGEPGVDGRRDRQPGRRGPGQVGEHPDNLRAQVGVGEAAAQRRARRVLEPDEVGEGAGVGRGDLDALTLRGRHLLARHGQDHHVAVGDVHALGADDDEQRLQIGVLALLGCGAQHHPARGWMARRLLGTVAVKSTGVSEISGAVTLPSCPRCGQSSIAVVCTTGSSGVATDNTKPISPAMVATQRVPRADAKAPKIARFGVLLRLLAHCVMAAP